MFVLRVCVPDWEKIELNLLIQTQKEGRTGGGGRMGAGLCFPDGDQEESIYFFNK